MAESAPIIANNVTTVIKISGTVTTDDLEKYSKLAFPDKKAVLAAYVQLNGNVPEIGAAAFKADISQMYLAHKQYLSGELTEPTYRTIVEAKNTKLNLDEKNGYNVTQLIASKQS